MSEERDLEPTAARLARARREGDVPRSPELVAAAAFGGASVAACTVVAPIGAVAHIGIAQAARGTSPVRAVVEIVALALVPAACGAACASLAGIAQTQGVVAAPVAIRVARLDPAAGLRRIFSRETPAHLARATLAFAAAACAMAPTIAHAVLGAARAPGIGGAAAAAWIATRTSLAIACSAGALFAIAEYRLLRGAWLRRLRMSVEELKREIKEQEGDPHARGQRRSRHRAMARGSLEGVRRAAFVLANPTHVAVALAYRPPEIEVPLVLSRASDAGALRVRELAAHYGIPVVEAPELARTLFAETTEGAVIAAEHYVAVAAVVIALTRSGLLRT